MKARAVGVERPPAQRVLLVNQVIRTKVHTTALTHESDQTDHDDMGTICFVCVGVGRAGADRKTKKAKLTLERVLIYGSYLVLFIFASIQ